MKKLILILAMCTSIACAGKVSPNASPLTKSQHKATQIVVALSDFQDGVIAANYSGWLSDSVALTAVKAVQVALNAVETSPEGAKSVVLGLISDLKKQVLDPKLVPYLDSLAAVIGAL